MNIVYLHQYFKTPAEAGGCRSYEFARRLAERGHQVDMVTSIRDPRVNERGWQECSVDGIRVHAIPVPYANAMPYKQRIVAFLRFAYRAARRGALLGPDVVFATSTPLTIALPGAYAGWLSRCPMVFEVRDLWPTVPVALGVIRGAVPIWAARRLELFAYRNAARVVALSPAMKDGVVRTGFPADRVHVIPNSSDVDFFAGDEAEAQRFRGRYEWLGDRPLVLYTGTFGLVNGVGYLVDVASAMRSMSGDVRFVLVGDGREAEEVRRQAQELGVLAENLFILPPVPRTELPTLLAAATVATSTVIDVPALWANSANKVFDAFAAGRPLVINYEGWQADLLRKTGAGIVVPPDDPAAGARLLAELLKDEERLARARQAARRLGEKRFSRDMLFEEFERVLRLAAEDTRR